MYLYAHCLHGLIDLEMYFLIRNENTPYNILQFLDLSQHFCSL